LSLVLLGDLMLGRIVNDALTKHDRQQVWGNFLPLLRGTEGSEQLVGGNLECAVTYHNEKYPKQFNFRLLPSNVDVLREASIDYVSLANNHILDYCVPGLIESVKVLKDEGIKFSGAGLKPDAQAPAYIQKGGYRFAIFSYSDHYHFWAATEKNPGINFVDPGNYDRTELQYQFSYAREQVDFVVVFIHWGPNWQWTPNDKIVDLGHALIDCGADIVFGHSSHHIQGVEVYNGHPIIYGAGGFIDDYAIDKHYRNDLGFMYRIQIFNNNLQRLELFPSKITHIKQGFGSNPPYISKVNRATGRDQSWVCSKMKQLSTAFGTKVDDLPGDGLIVQFGTPVEPTEKQFTPSADDATQCKGDR